MKIDKNNPQVRKNWEKLKKMIFQENVLFYILPSSKLQQIIAKGQHPICKEMPINRKAQLLSGVGVAIQSQMLWKWINGKLDEKTSFILQNSQIKVIGFADPVFGSGGIVMPK